jgi:hypothetical protein
MRKFASSLKLSSHNITNNNMSRIVSNSFNSNNNISQINNYNLDIKRNYRNSIIRSSDNDKLINEKLRQIDTTLTPEQRAHVDSIRKSIRGGPNSPRCKCLSMYLSIYVSIYLSIYLIITYLFIYYY